MIRATLDEALRRFDRLKNEVLLRVMAVSAAIDHRIPTIANDALDLSSNSPAGFDRVDALKSFLQHKTEGLRLIGIHGQAGIGKTTLLLKLWEEVSLQPPFDTRAFVQVGEGASGESLRKLQSRMLQQLGGPNEDFPSDDFGRGALKNHLLSLRKSNESVFLAIDNVWDREHLTAILPDHLASLLPSSSCIVITSRQRSVILKLLELCSLQPADEDHVLLFTPPYLSGNASKKLFADHALMRMEDHVELINSITPLCGGLPLALTVLGSVFRDEIKRQDPEWRKLLSKMQQENAFPRESQPVVKALELSYDRLEATHQKAFLDVVGFFYGWNWQTVGRIVGEDVLQDLKDSSLIRVAKGMDKCKQNEINHFGRPKANVCLDGPFEDVLDMHDLVFKFGKSLLQSEKNLLKIVRDDTEFDPTMLLPDVARKVRGFWCTMRIPEPITLSKVLREMTNLRFLYLNSSYAESERSMLSLHATGEEHLTSKLIPRKCQVRAMSLYKCEFSNLIMETMFSPEVREIYLEGCQDIVELPMSSTKLVKVQRLWILNCFNFRDLPPSCEKWEQLQELIVEGCDSMQEVPPALGTLPNLEIVVLRRCSGLTSVHALFNLQRLTSLVMDTCLSLQSLPTISLPFESLLRSLIISRSLKLQRWRTLTVSGCLKLQRLPSSICYASSLENLDVSWCEGLLELPEEMGELKSLKNLALSRCLKLQRLPSSICNVSSLVNLDVSWCERLLELPEEIGGLKSLKSLRASSCSKFQQLPSSICKASLLEDLDVSKCEGILELPEEMGELKSLKSLRAFGCSNLKRLPSSICKASSLENLDVSWCEGLLELPEEMGNLKSLKSLRASSCSKLQRLPSSICNASLLESLDVSQCKGLLELPKEVGELKSLKSLVLSRCLKLQRLPSSICQLSSLEELNLSGCQGLLELPEGMGELKSLRWLVASSCWELQTLPSSICNASSLENLYLLFCTGLLELPEEMGKLKSLKCLMLVGCRKLQRLPSSLCNASSLKFLDTRWCEGLMELPQEIEYLAALEKLDVRGCKRLTKLPKLLDKVDVDVRDCGSLDTRELPSSLNLRGEALSGWQPSLSELFRLSKLIKYLELRMTDRVTESQWGELQRMESLVGLRLVDEHGISSSFPSQVLNLTQLYRLKLEGFESLQVWPQGNHDTEKNWVLPHLEGLWLHRFLILKELPFQMCSALPNAKSLKLVSCPSIEGWPPKFADMKLENLFLDDCGDALCSSESFQMLPISLRTLHVHRMQLTTVTMTQQIRRLQALERFALDFSGAFVDLISSILYSELDDLFQSKGKRFGIKKVDDASYSFGCDYDDFFLGSRIFGRNHEYLKEMMLQESKSELLEVESIPSAMWNFQALTSLYVSGCRSMQGSLAFTNLESLVVAHCRSFQCSSLPPLHKLRELCLKNCETVGAFEAASLTALQHLTLVNCKAMRSVPMEGDFGLLKMLAVLEVVHCEQLESLPDGVCQLRNLWRLDLSWCGRLAELPLQLGSLSNLRFLELRGCGRLSCVPGLRVQQFSRVSYPLHLQFSRNKRYRRQGVWRVTIQAMLFCVRVRRLVETRQAKERLLAHKNV